MATPCFVWKGIDGDSRIFQIDLNPNLQWQPAGLWQTSSKPAILALPDRMLLAHKGPDNDSGIYFSTWASGANGWSNAQPVAGVGTSWAPSLAAWGDGAIMVWNGVGSDTRIWCSQYNAATNQWGDQYLTRLPAYNNGPIQSGSTPAIVNYRGQLLMVWRGEGDNDNLYYALSTDGLNWSGNKQVLNAASTIGPALVVWGPYAYLLFKGGSNDTTMYGAMYDLDSSNWFTGSAAGLVLPLGPFGTSHGPSACAVDDTHLIMTWKGVPGDDTIYFSNYVPNIGWEGQTVISNAGSSVGPAVCMTTFITSDP